MIHSIEKVGFFWKLPISLYIFLASFCKVSKLSFEKGYITKKYLTNLVTPKLKTLPPKWHWCTKIGAIYRIGNPKTKISIYSSRDPKPHVVSWPIVAMQCNTGNPWITRFQSTRSTAVPGLTRFFLKEIAWFGFLHLTQFLSEIKSLATWKPDQATNFYRLWYLGCKIHGLILLDCLKKCRMKIINLYW